MDSKDTAICIAICMDSKDTAICIAICVDSKDTAMCSYVKEFRVFNKILYDHL